MHKHTHARALTHKYTCTYTPWSRGAVLCSPGTHAQHARTHTHTPWSFGAVSCSPGTHRGEATWCCAWRSLC